MNRGTVVSLNKRTAVVLTPEGQFVRVKRKAHFEVGEEIYDNIAVRSFPRVRQRLVQTGAFASVILLVLFGFLIFRTPPVVAYVSMDINPSIELGLDVNQRVRELRAMNEDAQAIVAGLKYRGQNLETVMNELARKLVDQHILTNEDGEIVIASVPVRPLQEHWETQVAQTMKRILSDATKQGNPDQQVTLDVTTVFLPVEVRNEAEANGVSSGKMAFWLISKDQGHEITLETIKSESLKNIAASWGGVNQVMSQYEQKKVSNDNKENAGSNNNNGTPTPNNNMDDKGNKDGIGNNPVETNNQNVDNKKVDNKKKDIKKNDNTQDNNKKNGSTNNSSTSNGSTNNGSTNNGSTNNDTTSNDNKKDDAGNKQNDKNIDGNDNNQKNDVTKNNNDVTQKNDKNINQNKVEVKKEDQKKSWELLLDEAKQGKSSKSDHSNGSKSSDDNKGSKSSNKSGNSDSKND